MADKVVALSGAREWKAARPDVMRSDWQAWSRTPDADIRYGLTTLRARSRHEAQNSDHARAFLREVKSNVIGPDGVRLQCHAKLRGGKPDRRTRDAVEQSWRAWGQVGECEVTGQLSWADEQRRCIETVARDGEAIYRMLSGWDNRWRIALQAIDPEALDVEYNDELSNGNYVVMGVELNAWRRPVAYHLTQEDPLTRSYRRRQGRARVRVPAEQILHIYVPEWVWQTRGVPWAATALRRIHDIAGYEESAVVAARAGASKMGFFEQDSESMPLMRDDGTTEPGALGAEDVGGQLYDKFDPGSIGVLPPGYSFKGWDPRYPHAEHGNFIKSVLRGAASGLGVSYNTLANDLEGVNYSSLRQGALTERALWKMLQGWIIGSFHERVYRAWLDHAVVAGAIAFNGRPLDDSRLPEMSRVVWQPRRWQWVDPMKEAQAAKLEIEMRVRSIGDVIRERGADPDEVWQEIADERAKLADLGISVAEATQAAVAAPDTGDDDDE